MLTASIPDDQKMLINELVDGACFCMNDDGMDIEALSRFISENYYLVPKQLPEQASDTQSTNTISFCAPSNGYQHPQY